MSLLSVSVSTEIPWQIYILFIGLFVWFAAMVLIAVFIEKEMRGQGLPKQESKSLSYLLFWPRGVIRYLKEYGAGESVICPQCGKSNRLHLLKFTKGKCLSCKKEISLSDVKVNIAKYTTLQKAIIVSYIFAWLGIALLLAFIVLLFLSI